MKNITKIKGFLYICIILIFVSFIGLMPQSVYADSGLTVNNALILGEVNPGNNYTHSINVKLGTSAEATGIAIQIGGIGQTLRDQYQLLQASEDKSSYSAREYIKSDIANFYLEPGDSREVKFTLDIPKDVGVGGRYALIKVTTIPGEGETVGVITVVNIPVYLTISKTKLIHTGKIDAVSAEEAVTGKPVYILTTIENTGNHHYKVKGEVEIADSNGKLLDTVYVSLTSSIIPTMSRQLKATFIPKNELSLGIYNIKSKVTLEDGTLLDEATGTFEVKAPYVPPPAPAVVDLKPSTASALNTDDGRISIAFPQGSVLADAQISLRSNPPDQLPAAPVNHALGTTSFRVDGLTGLLLKPAAVKVKYSSADLAKAEGDPARLVLARWDEANSQWTVLKTSRDYNTQTLNTETNQFSLWAVLIGPAVSVPLVGASPSIASVTVPASNGGISWWVLAVVILLAGVIGVLLTSFILHKSKKHH